MLFLGNLQIRSYIPIVALKPNRQRASYYEETYFLTHSLIIRPLPLRILVKGFVQVLEPDFNTRRLWLSIMCGVGRSFKRRHRPQSVRPEEYCVGKESSGLIHL
jgi:hypothetical protein